LLFWKIAFRGLFRHARRNLLTGASISLGLVGVCLLGGYIMRMERYLAAQSVYLALNGHVIVYAQNGVDRYLEDPEKYSFSASEQAVLLNFARADPRVARAFPMLKTSGLVYNGCSSVPFMASAIAPADIAWARTQPAVEAWVPELTHLSRGVGFWAADPGLPPVNISDRLAAILSKDKVAGDAATHAVKGVLDCSTLAGKEAARADPAVQLVGMAFPGGMALADATIVGHVNTGMAFQDDTALLMPLSLAQQAYGTEKASSISIFLKSERDLPAFLHDFKAQIVAKGIGAEAHAFSDEEISPFYVGGMQFNWVMLALFLLLVCSVVGISISNSLYISLMERKSELGTLRSIGFRQIEISRLLVLESFLLVLFAIRYSAWHGIGGGRGGNSERRECTF
jgi:putative ABC transport system permease protein